MEVLLEISGYDVDGGVEMTVIQVHINVQKSDFSGGGGGMPSKFDGIASVEFKELF